MQEATIPIRGMSCNHCVMAVKRALTALPGVEVRNVEIGRATVQFDPAQSSLDAIRRSITDAGFEPQT
jgi:copper chaperone